MTATQTTDIQGKRRLAYRPNELPTILGIGRTSVFEAIKLGKLRARKFGAATVILHDDAMEFLNSLPEAK
jgi:hypothetical protein